MHEREHTLCYKDPGTGEGLGVPFKLTGTPRGERGDWDELGAWD